ncbi:MULTISPECIES: phosphoenolpyruvate--protein phosphotransferase [unclassified Caulobacter]|uniref:phosphoenolpyruvate--protein phosphotransferase n=1 Tax=unclassified Caulobacter TaxID=2648921 RepID=UPI000D3D8979|nr:MULTISPECIES: phosphoenolpyruvate--protein phosphotransferase [unclassified Caulobacter]PTS88140.1 phosphoenolpyruvate--protein phosphotransferase [Caulobacter sp. HMWF009]PTT06648.1 phosphoenolpyruvate--protein phosphotransferase [Caulobacter sp. HMWF025]
MANLVLSAPLKGWIAPLDETPDAVFAQRMLGDGLAIDPTGSTLHAPCDAVVISVHRARHAVSLRAANGAEILMHLGLETVALDGAGFEVLVREGETVTTGQPLIAFDLDFLAQNARSLITPVLVTNLEAFRIVTRHQDRPTEVGEALMELVSLEARLAAADTQDGAIEATVVVPLKHGLHARPAARIAEALRPFAAELSFIHGDRRANARSPIGVMAMAIQHGETIRVLAGGADAEAALAAVVSLIESGMGEAGPAPARAVAAVSPVVVTEIAAIPAEGVLKGVRAAPGLAIGKAVRLAHSEIAVREAGAGIAIEQAALAEAMARVRGRLTEASSHGDRARQAILAAHLAILDDPELTAQAQALIAQGKSAGHAWKQAIGGYVEALKGLGDARMAERVDDLIDLQRQVLRALAGEDEHAASLAPGSILLADELMPSQLMGLEAGVLAGFCTARGGPTSHVAILAAAMGIPALVAAGGAVLTIEDGAALILDADSGQLRVAPDAPALEAAQTRLAQQQERKAAARATAHQTSVTRDGARIEVYGNVGSLGDAEAAAANGAEGCGLLRTEFLFLERETPPDEDEQARQYQEIATALDGKPLIVRTLDVGGDKAAPYLPIPAEENPALGLRGVRVSLWRPQLLKTQLRAILRVQPVGQCRIMVPMVASLDELRAVRAVLDEARRELGVSETIELGVMVETPAAAVTADLLAAEADFLSIGTNDLTQYVLAMDRGNPEVAARIDALHPAVLRMIAQTCAGGARHGRWVGVCGGAASDLAAVPILLGLGVTELSATASSVPEVKALVRRLDLEACRRLAAQALDLSSPEAVRELAGGFLAQSTEVKA